MQETPKIIEQCRRLDIAIRTAAAANLQAAACAAFFLLRVELIKYSADELANCAPVFFCEHLNMSSLVEP